MEGGGLAKGSPRQQTAPRAQDRVGALSALERIRQVAKRDQMVRFTTLLDHVYDVERSWCGERTSQKPTDGPGRRAYAR